MGLYLEHKRDWNGWNGPIKDSRTLELDVDDLEKSQAKIDEYINEHSLYHEYPSGKAEGIKIDLKSLIE